MAGSVPALRSVIAVGVLVSPTCTVPRSIGLGLAVTTAPDFVPYETLTLEMAWRWGNSPVPAVKPKYTVFGSCTLVSSFTTPST